MDVYPVAFFEMLDNLRKGYEARIVFMGIRSSLLLRPSAMYSILGTDAARLNHSCMKCSMFGPRIQLRSDGGP